jgi:hypothetical protein
MAYQSITVGHCKLTLSHDGKTLIKVKRADGFVEDNHLDLGHFEFTTVESKAFEGLDNCETLVLPSCVREIKSRAFAGCASLEQLFLYVSQLPVVSIDAFADCPSLKKLYLGSNKNVFYRYESLFSCSDVASQLISACQEGSISQLGAFFNPHNKPERVGNFNLSEDAAAAKSFLLSSSKKLAVSVGAGCVSMGDASSSVFFGGPPVAPVLVRTAETDHLLADESGESVGGPWGFNAHNI